MSANQPTAGTGAGGVGAPYGSTAFKSRKMWAYVVMVLAILAVIALTSYMSTPIDIANSALYMVGAGGVFLIGGQALVDTMFRSKWGAAAAAVGGGPVTIHEERRTTTTGV